MRETHTEIYKGWTVTVWMGKYELWNYIVSKGETLYSGDVQAINRTNAVQTVIDILNL